MKPIQAHSSRIANPRTRGLTLIEVLVASVILSVAALAALEMLARNDSSSLFARRQALASVEAERLLSEAAAAVKSQNSAAKSEELDAGTAAEALGGCTATVSESRESMSIAIADGQSVVMPVVRVIAEIRDPSGALLATLERIVPSSSSISALGAKGVGTTAQPVSEVKR